MPLKKIPLTAAESDVLIHKGTEPPFTGRYDQHFQNGLYVCRDCHTPLYRSKDKFPSHCGWPSFDDEIAEAVARVPDADGMRTEIQCAHCGGHLGHVFEGEYLTPKNTRHCVNSLSLRFLTYAYFAGGCFWGVEHLMQQLDGVYAALSGYMGGETANPSYHEVCAGNTGHVEAVKVIYDPTVISFKALAKFFFEIHDPTQRNGQGPDLGSQYASVLFVDNDDEKTIAAALINQLIANGFDVATRLQKVTTFWPAEPYHQDYYEKNGQMPYCHRYQKRFP